MGWFRGLRRSSRILVSGAGVFLTVGLMVIAQAAPAAPAYASGSRQQICYGSQCINAWNTGPAVETFPPNTSNDYFYEVITTTGNTGIQFEGSGNSSQDCIGDWNNSSTDAKAGLYSNCGTTQPAWGANFRAVGCANGGIAFYNLHWKGYLGPQYTPGTGVAFYLNKPTPYCFYESLF
jgi:hypothetical protein